MHLNCSHTADVIIGYFWGSSAHLNFQNVLFASWCDSGLLKLLKFGIFHIQQVILIGRETVQDEGHFSSDWRLNTEAFQGGCDAKDISLVFIMAAGLGIEKKTHMNTSHLCYYNCAKSVLRHVVIFCVSNSLYLLLV